MPRDTSYRVLLPAEVEPEHYDLTLEPDFERFMFDGEVKIRVDVKEATDRITVHAKNLMIGGATFTPSAPGSAAFTAEEIVIQVKEMTCSFGFGEMLPVGGGTLEIKFRGVLNDKMAGFYRSQYTDSKGNKRFMATTQFEAIDARQCFPCWDEPAKKATFVVTLIFPDGLTALSNMPQSLSELRKDGKRVETFLPTPKMSTYLLAFCIGEYEYISGQTNSGTVCRVFCCPGNRTRCGYALRCCIRALEFYNEFFGMPFPLPKMDMIAIPDFAAGAMENWGLVTYREVALLCDEATVSATQKQRICSVIAHELAHQWFGNLVTMGWWDDLWLNEGFANWMQNFCSDKLHPEWNIWEQYVGQEQQRALQLDALRSSHPIQVPIKKAQEVEEVFDAISYCKGGSVVRLIYAVLGEEQFQEGLRLYFRRHAYGNTETTDLWRAWSEASGKDVGKMMQSWTEQMGFPVVKVLTDPLEKPGTTEIEVEQRWFLADGSCQAGDDAKRWTVPIIMGPGSVSFLEPGSNKGKVQIPGAGSPSTKLCKLNHGQHIPIRVQYPGSMMKRFAADVQSLLPEDRIGLLSDTYALCKAGLVDAVDLVNLLKGFGAETNDKVWGELCTVMDGLNRIVCQGLGGPVAASYVDFCAKLVAPAFEKVGWDAKPGDSDNAKKLRSTLLGSVAKYCYKDPAIAAEAKRRFEAFSAAPNDSAVLSADIRPAVLSIVMRAEGGDAIFNKILLAHDEATDGAVKIHTYGAIGDAPTAALRKRALTWALGGSVRSQDLIYIPMHMAVGSREGADQVFAWLQQEYEEVHQRVGLTSMILFNSFVRISGSGFVTAEQASEVEAFWKSRNNYHMIEKTVSQTIENIKSNSGFVEHLRRSEASKPEAWA